MHLNPQYFVKFANLKPEPTTYVISRVWIKEHNYIADVHWKKSSEVYYYLLPAAHLQHFQVSELLRLLLFPKQ